MINLATAYSTCKERNNPGREYELLLKATELAPNYGLAHVNIGNYLGKYGMEWYVVEKDETNTDQPYCVKRTTNKEMLRLAVVSYHRAAELDDKLRGLCDHQVAIVEQFLRTP